MFNKENTVFVYPGQGSQKVGMGQDFATSELTKNLFEKANDILDRDITQIMLTGDQEELNKTNNAQVALFITGFAACEYLKQSTGKTITQLAGFLAGHSLGEYTALAQAEVFSFEDGLKLVDQRSKAMLKATQDADGSMAAILNLDVLKVLEITKATNTVLANDNTIGQVVISGEKENIIKACELCKEAGAKRAIVLPVSGAFHSPLMETAANQMAKIIDQTPMNDAIIPVIMNVTAQPTTNVEQIKQNMKKQITGSVHWVDTMKILQENSITNVAEFGVGNVLCGLFKKFNKELNLQNITKTEDVK